MHLRTSWSNAGDAMFCSAEMAGGSEIMMAEIRLAWLLPANAFCPVAIS
jgi:hypothetical protein